MKTLILTDEEIEQIKISIVHRGIKSGSNKLNLILQSILDKIDIQTTKIV